MTLCLTIFLSLVSSALAMPLLGSRTVYDPPITTPNAQTVWKAGNATGIPDGVTGMLQLGFLTSDSENLSTILATGFNLSDEKVQITIPDVVTRTNYILVLFGDSGNASPEFTIQGSASSSSSGPTSKTTVVTSTTTAPSSGSTTTDVEFSTGSVTPLVSQTESKAPGSSTESQAAASSTPPVSGSSPAAAAATNSSTNSGWSTNKLTTGQLLMAAATAYFAQCLLAL
ncbi:hypothetical protein HMN09_00965900 [Mycena chlorophos]|uniref:Uncharacterized protein n=1 Tax=Mycena chlorophos TaxID=658473 RepID=A0A8H6SKP7_MYCCL|nr:hypothetical protein HMN09_00965900 [Mycena chlorophos]